MAAFLDWADDFLWTYQNVVYAVGINGILALSMYAVMAVGQLSLGQAAFMGIGAYTAALLTLNLAWPLWLILPAAAVVPALVALAIGVPTLRLTGVYLAIATIGLGEMLRVALINADFTGGALGLGGIPQRVDTGMIYGLLLLLLAASFLICRSRIGRAMEAMREDEVAASVMGVNLPVYRMTALVVSAALAGLAGSLSALTSSIVSPGDYGFDAAVTILSYALLGGLGSPLGPVIAALLLTVLPEALRALQDFRLVLNGLIIVLVVLFLPRGLLPWRIRRIAAPTPRPAVVKEPARA